MVHTLVLGGARSGKSGFAESFFPTDCTYIATARPFHGEFDADFQRRIAKHIKRRPAHWRTEDTRDLLEVLADASNAPLLVDDLGTWLTARIDQAAAWENPLDFCAELSAQLCSALQSNTHREVVLVTPEVGMGIVPEHASARHFRDAIGSLNAQVAAVCDQVFLVVAGQALQLKP